MVQGSVLILKWICTGIKQIISFKCPNGWPWNHLVHWQCECRSARRTLPNWRCGVSYSFIQFKKADFFPSDFSFGASPGAFHHMSHCPPYFVLTSADVNGAIDA